MITAVPEFEPEGFSKDIFIQRYAFTEKETWPEMCRRVAHQMALAETPKKVAKYEQSFYDVLVRNLFIPGGRILYGSGRPNPFLLNCFVLNNETLDSREGWGQLLNDHVVTASSGGGTGIDFSPVRPEGAEISGTRGTCSGPVSLMEAVNAVAKIVVAGGNRRSANMFSLDLEHPDVLKFLDKKLKNGELDMANVSLTSRNTSKFIEAVKNDEKWELSWKGKYKREISAKHLWNRIVKNTWESAEPGVLQLEFAEEESTISYIQKLSTSNPCLAYHTQILTENGYESIGDLVGNVRLTNELGRIVGGKVWSSGVRKVVRLSLSNGSSMKCTPNHVFKVSGGREVEAQDLKGERITPFVKENSGDGVYTKLGFIQGDGNLTRLNSSRHLGLEINLGRKDEDVKDLFSFNESGRTFYTTEFTEMLKDLKFSANTLPERGLPETFKTWLSSDKLSFLRGLFSANGCVIKSGKRVALKSTCKKLIEEVSETLQEFDILSYVTCNKRKLNKFSNGEYWCKESYDLNISRHPSLLLFSELIGFVHTYKRDSLRDVIVRSAPKVMGVRLQEDEEEVFDFSLEGDTHWGVAEGVIVHNCGEIIMPSGGDSCCLGSIVLPRFVTASKSIDWPMLGEVVRLAVRFLDNVLSINAYPLESQRVFSNKFRRLGLGTTGLADTMMMLGMVYGSETSLEFIDKLYRFISKQAYETSVLLAAEKGMFAACDPELHVKTGFVKRMTPKIKSMIREHGIRNCALLTQAPVGTTSIVSGNCSSGIEPMYAPVYWRNYFDEGGRKRELCFHPLFAAAMDRGEDVGHFIPSTDVAVESHFEVQKTMQKHVDNAISKTINIPKDYPVKDLSEIWLKYLPFLKGTTFYREGSRNFVDENGVEHEPPLVAIPMKEAIELYHTQKEVKKEAAHVDDCVSGTCDL